MAVHLSQLSAHAERIQFAPFMFMSRLVLPFLHDCPENGTIFGRKCFSHSAYLDFLYKFCLILTQTTKTPVKHELGRFPGNVFSFNFIPT